MDFPMQWCLELKGSDLNSQQVSVPLRRSRLCPAYPSTYQVSVGNLGRRVDHRLLWTKLRQQFGYLEERSLVYKDLKTPKNTLGRTQFPVRDGTLSQLCRLREQRSLDILLTFMGKEVKWDMEYQESCSELFWVLLASWTTVTVYHVRRGAILGKLYNQD